MKRLAGIPDDVSPITDNILASITNLKKEILQSKYLILDLEETLISLGISAATNLTAQQALTRLKELKGCEVHLPHIPTPGDGMGLK